MLSWPISFFLIFLVVARAFKKKSLNASGLIGAFIVGLITIRAGFEFGVILLFFFFTSSYFTKYKAHIKKLRDPEYHEGSHEGNRNIVQVMANGGFQTLCCIIYLYLAVNTNDPLYYVFFLDTRNQFMKTFLLAAFLASYSTCTADTWASELGILSNSKPRLILPPFRVVEHGTNGGVTIFGNIAALAGGLSIGILAYICSILSFSWNGSNYFGNEQIPSQCIIVLFCVISGFVGTTVDSILGLLFEYSGFDKQTNKVIYKFKEGATKIAGFMPVLNGSWVNTISSIFTGLFMATMLVLCW